ncbi:UBN2 domain-containing protein [Cephalotus follicularis]|uniref:UBN2 domain-containing protein n=1 Tax=Cephalotus follicularis TaxID=3775 RepID=A0A1Q3BHZ7_CEPFO|nr:UBN2 domain-containing protein [Cephalotus follicularis]
MTIFLQSLDYQLWHIIVNGPSMPTRMIEGVVSLKPENEFNDNDFRMLQLNSKAKHVLFCVEGPNEFNRISSCDTAKEMWDMLEVTYEGTNQVKESKISMLKEKFNKEQFKKKNEHSKNKKAMVATWDDSNPSSSEESESDEEVVNLALMAMEEDASEEESDNEVQFSFDELKNAYEKLYVDYESVCLKNKSLKKNAMSISKEIENLKSENSKYISKIESLKNKNSFYMNEIEVLNVSSKLSNDSMIENGKLELML